MPSYLVKLKDGREFDVEADSPPTKEEIMSFLQQGGTQAQAPEDTGQGRTSSFISSVGRGAASIVPGVIGGTGYLTGSEGLVETANTIEAGINRALPVNPAYENEFLMKAGQALGQVVPMIGTGGVAGAVGKSMALARGLEAGAAAAKGTQLAGRVMLGSGMLQGTRGGGQAAEQYGMEGGAAYARALLGGAIEGATEKLMFGMGTELSPIKKIIGDALDKGASSIAKAATIEGAEEGVAEIGGNLATSLLAPSGVETPGMFEGAGESAALGAVAGGAIGGFNAALGGGEVPEAPTVEGVPVVQPPAPIQEEERLEVESAVEKVIASIESEIASGTLTQEPGETGEAFIGRLNTQAEELAKSLETVTVETAAANADVLPATAAALQAEASKETLDQIAAQETPVGALEPEASGVLLPEDAVVEDQSQNEPTPIVEETVPPEQPVPVVEEAIAAQSSEEDNQKALLNDLQIAEEDYRVAEQKAQQAEDLFFTERDKYDSRKKKPRNYTYAGPKEHQDRILALANDAFKARQFANSVAQDLGKARKNATPAAPVVEDQFQKTENVVAPAGEAEVGLGMEEPTQTIERDVTKPEQMTPEEINRLFEEAKDWANTPDDSIVEKYQKQFNASDAYIQANPYAPEYWRENQRKVASGATPSKQHTRVLNSAIDSRKPLSAAAVDAYKITLPEGYVRQGDLYVFQPTPAAQAPTPESAGEAEVGLGMEEPTVLTETTSSGKFESKRKVTQEGVDRVEAAKQRLRDVMNNPDIIGRQRADMIENGKNLISFLETHADTRKPLDTDYVAGDQVAFTGEDAPEGFRSFIYLEGAKAGATGVTLTKEEKAKDVERSQREFREQQEGMKRVRDTGKSDQMPKSKTPAPQAPTSEPAPPAKPAAEVGTGDVGVLARGKPRESIVFKKPVATPLGDVIGYSWSSQLVEDVDKMGEPVLRRISNWEEAANNAETGRDIVHRFLIKKPDGTTSEVSLESTFGKMTDSDKKTIKAVVSAAKKLPFMRAELAELQDLQKQTEADYQRTQKLAPDPTKLELREPDAKWLSDKGSKGAYLDGVFLGYVESSELNAKGELANKAKFIFDNAWKWRDAKRTVRITDTQKDRAKSLTRSIKKAEDLLNRENVEVAKVTTDEQPASLAEAGPPAVEMKTPSATADQPAPISQRPSLGSTGKQIIDAWRSLQGVQVAPGETVVGWDVNGGGTYAFINDQLVKLKRDNKGFESTYTDATDADWQDVSDALDRGALQVEVRKITGLGNYPKVDAGKTVKVLHQATGKPLQEFLDTPEGAAYEARMQKSVAERGPKTDEFGATNKVFTKKAKDKAVKNIGGQVNLGGMLDPAILKETIPPEQPVPVVEEAIAAQSSSRDTLAEEFEELQTTALKQTRSLVNGGMLRGASIKSPKGGSLLVTKPAPGDAKDSVFRVTRLDRDGTPTTHNEISEKDWTEFQSNPDKQRLALLGELFEAVQHQLRPDVMQSVDISLGGNKVHYTYSLRNRDVAAGAYPRKGFVEAVGREAVFDRLLSQEEIDSYELEPLGAFLAPSAKAYERDNLSAVSEHLNKVFGNDWGGVGLVHTPKRSDISFGELDGKKVINTAFVSVKEAEAFVNSLKEFGSTNKVFTKKAKDKATKNIGGTVSMGGALNPAILKDVITVGGFYVEGGVRSFAEFSAKLIEEFGAGIQKYLRPAYDELRKRTDIDTTGMDPEDGGETAPKAPETPKPKGDITLNPSEIEVIPEDMARAEADKAANTERWQKASVSTEPVSVLRRLDGSYKMIDGHHRLLGAMDRGETIEAKITQEKKLEPLKKAAPPPAEPPPPAAPAAGQPAPLEGPVSVANEPLNKVAEIIGLPRLETPLDGPYAWPQAWEDARAEFDLNPRRGEELVKGMIARPRPPTPLEEVILLREGVTRTNAFNAAVDAQSKATEADQETANQRVADAINALAEIQQASALMGTLSGRALNFRKMSAWMDFSLANMTTRLQGAKQKELTKEEIKDAQDTHKKITEIEKKIDETQASAGAEAELTSIFEETFKEAMALAKKNAEDLIIQSRSAAKQGKSMKDFLVEKREEARKRIRLRGNNLNMGLNPADLFDHAVIMASYIAEGIVSIADLTAKMIGDFGPNVEKHIPQIKKEADALLEAEQQVFEAPEAAPTKTYAEQLVESQGEDLSDRWVYNRVKEWLVEQGEAGLKKDTKVLLDEVFKVITKEVNEFDPSITEQQLRDMFSGYGKVKFPNPEAAAVKLRQMRRLELLLDKLERARAGVAPLRAGLQRDETTVEERNALKLLNQTMKDLDIPRAPSGANIKTPLDAVKSRLKNSIEDLNKQIKDVKEGRGRTERPRKGVDYDPEATKLKEDRDALQKELDKLDPPRPPTVEERIQTRLKDLDKQIAKLKRRVKERDYQPKQNETPITEQIQVKTDERDDLNQTLKELRIEAEGQPVLTQEQVNEAAQKALTREIKALEKQISEQDFTPKEGLKPEDTPEYRRLRARVEALRKQRDQLKEDLGIRRKQKTDAELVAAAVKSVTKSVDELERRIRDLEFAAEKRPSKTPETLELKVLRDRRKELQKELQGLRKAEEDAAKDPVAEKIKADRKQLQRMIKGYEDRIAKGDFRKRPKIAKVYDDSLMQLEIDLDNIKAEWSRKVFEAHLASRPPLKRMLDTGGQVLNTSRAILTSFDLSAVLRQGGFIGLGNPFRAARNITPMLKAFTSDDVAKASLKRLKQRPNWKNYVTAGLYIAETDQTKMSAQEEAFMSRWIDKIPSGAKGLFLGSIVRGSQRAYLTFLNNLRADTFDALVNQLQKGPTPTREEMESIAYYINTATGRGDLGKGAINQGAVLLNTVFFAPRLVASRFQIIGGMPIFKATGRTKALVLQEYAKFFMGASIVYALAGLAQDDDDEPLEFDPRSSDFLKVRYGDTRVDPLGGLIQATVFVSRIVAGETKSAKGKITPIRDTMRLPNLFREAPKTDKVPYGGRNVFSLASDFARTKFSPAFGGAVDIVTGENVIGETVTPADVVMKMTVPMSFEEAAETLEAHGMPKGPALTILMTFGAGVMTYNDRK